MSTEKTPNEHSAATDWYLRFNWAKPSDIGELLCENCCLGDVELVGANEPYSDQYWMCANCDSTFANWIYPLSLGQRCDVWNNHICSECDWIGQGVSAGKCQSCRRQR